MVYHIIVVVFVLCAKPDNTRNSIFFMLEIVVACVLCAKMWPSLNDVEELVLWFFSHAVTCSKTC